MASYKAYKPTGEITKIYPEGTLDPPKFIPSFYEWLIANGSFLGVNGFQENGDTTIYTIPNNNSYYVIAATLYWSNRGVVALPEFVFLFLGNNETMTLIPSTISQDHDTNPLNFFPPIKLSAGETIIVRSSNANVFACADIMGFLVPNSFIPEF